MPQWISAGCSGEIAVVQSFLSRPIVRGKARSNVAFGATISISATGNGFTFLDRLSFDPYNEGEDLQSQAPAFDVGVATIQR
jgi:hypothetical protein